MIELNPPRGRVPVLDDGFVLPESEVIMEYLEERYPEPALLPADLGERARARLLVNRFDERLGDDYYAFRRGDDNDLAGKLAELEVGQSLFADVAYVPWVIRARDVLGVELPERIATWLAGLERRPSIAAEVEIVKGSVTEIAIEELAARLGTIAIVDVRTPQEYDGTLGQPCDPRQGHIPGARNIDVYQLMQLDPGQIESTLAIEAGSEVVAYCHSGSRSAIATQMLRALGYDARNYVGSWHEWSRHDDLPFER